MDEDTYRIVVGHGLDAPSDGALAEAITLAARIEGSEIHVVHVIGRPSRRDAAENVSLLDDAMRDLRARVAAIVERAAPRLPARLHVRFGEIARAVHQVAVDYDASLVLVGTHGRRGLDRLRHGSVAEELVRTARLPVLVAHPKDFAGIAASARPDDPRPGAELRGDQAMSEVLISSARTSHISGLV